MTRMLKVSMNVAWWERVIEWTGYCERWEYMASDGRWRKFWRRNGSIPKAAR